MLKVTTATQTGEAVDEVLRNNDSTLIRLLVTGQDLTNGYKLCPDGQVGARSGRGFCSRQGVQGWGDSSPAVQAASSPVCRR